MLNRSVTPLLITATVALAAWSSRAAEGEAPTAVMARAMAEAEASLRYNETQVAESRYRQVLLEGWLLRGQLEVAKGDLAAAQSAFEKAASSSIETRRAFHWQALLHLQLDQPAEATRLLTRLAFRHPEDVTVRRLLAQALIAEGRYELAVQELEEARTFAPGDVELAFTLATGYLRVGKLEQAREIYDRVAAERPIPQVHLLIGRSYGDFAHYEDARAAFESALAMDPEVRGGHYYLGTAKLLAAGRDALEPAIGHFEKARAQSPDDPTVNLFLGTALVSSRRFAEAVPALEMAALHEPTRIEARRYLGSAYLVLDRAVDAVAVLRRALAEDESRAKVRQLAAIHYQLGLALRRQGEEAEAAHHFAEAEIYSAQQVEGERDSLTRFLNDQLAEGAGDERAKPPLDLGWLEELTPEELPELGRKVTAEMTRAYLNLGIVHLQAGRPERAVGLVEQAAELDPSFPGVQATLGTALFNAEHFERAAGPLSAAFELEPSNTALARMTAMAHLHAGSPARAVELLRDDPERATHPSLQYAYGLALVRAGRAAEAQALFDRLLADNAGWPELHVAIGQSHAQQGDYEAAVASLERALELRADVPEARATLGELYLRQGELDLAERHLRGELESRPDDHASRYQLATVLDLNRRSSEAKTELLSVLDARPHFADARYLLGKILLAEGAAEDASAHLEAAAGLSPEDPNIAYQLGQAYQRLGRREQAQRQFELFRELKAKVRSSGP